MQKLIAKVRQLPIVQAITCGICGGPMVNNGREYVCMKCTNQ